MILLISDVQCHYGVINAQLAHATEELGHEVSQILVLGDLGAYETNLHTFFRRDGHRFDRPVSFIEGNHEDFTAFDALVASYADVLTYLPRSSVQQLDRWRMLCLGGTRYMDALSTPMGSEIVERDIVACLAHAPGEVDLVISHDCPMNIGVRGAPGFEHYGVPGIPGSGRIAAHHRPRFWFFGHHHHWHDCEVDGTRYLGLPMSWHGYCLLDSTGEVHCVERKIDMPADPWWLRFLGMK